MGWKQKRSVNTGTTDNSGWCQRFVGNAFGFSSSERPYAYAIDAWNGAKKKHADKNFPAGVAVQVYFNWTGTIDGKKANYGDTAIRMPDGRIFGTPLAGAGKTNRYDSSVEARAAAIGGGATYLGWSEDTNGQDVVEFVPDPPAEDPRDKRIRELEAALAAKPKEVVKEVIKEVKVEVPVEKIVEKVVEKPVEKIVEKVVTNEVVKKEVVDPTYYPAADLLRALLQKAVSWFNTKKG